MKESKNNKNQKCIELENTQKSVLDRRRQFIALLLQFPSPPSFIAVLLMLFYGGLRKKETKEQRKVASSFLCELLLLLPSFGACFTSTSKKSRSEPKSELFMRTLIFLAPIGCERFINDVYQKD